MNEFTKRIYEVVCQIPRGRVASYGQVAALAGNPRGARGVGFALHRNPQPGVIPCHRVVFKDGSVCTGFAFGGPQVQRRMLEEEGVVFLPDGRVDMARCRWL
ncbi:MAG TPA: MGMT family protein [Candidatus Ruthenibacterium merdigallinarum]|nr:MGMT family protein [Candidatus Ruthenibacterium merdigallinarum]